MQINHGAASIKTLGIGISIVDYLFEGLSAYTDSKESNQSKHEAFIVHKISIQNLLATAGSSLLYNSNYQQTVIMNDSSEYFNHSKDETLDMLKDFLPEIEQELRNHIEAELEEEYQQMLKEELEKIEKQGQIEFQDALDTLEEETRQLRHEKERELEIELIKLKEQNSERQKIRLAQAQQRFIQEHFDDRILTHPSMAQIQEQLENQIAEQLMQKYDAIREKRLKQVKIRFQSRENKEREQIDKSIMNEIFSKSGLQELKADLHKFKISLASMKSKYNLKISKIVKEIKDLTARCKQIEYQNSDMLIEQLEKEIEELKESLESSKVKQNESHSLEDSSFIYNRGNNYSLAENMAKHKVFNLINEQANGNNFADGQYINEDIDMESDDSLDELSQSENQQRAIPPPPQSKTQLLNNLLTGGRQQTQSDHYYQTQQNDIYLQIPQPLLKFNVAKMLRQNWREDSFDRYLSLRNEKQNNHQIPNVEPQNNFQSLYQQHLKKLNRDLKVPKTKKLTERAKQQILMNFGSQRQKSGESYF